MEKDKQTRMVRVLSGDELWAANAYAAEHITTPGHTAQYLNYGALQSIIDHNDPDTRYPVAYHFLHGDSAVRCVIVLDNLGHLGVVDIELNFFSALPTAQIVLDEDRVEEYVRNTMSRKDRSTE